MRIINLGTAILMMFALAGCGSSGETTVQTDSKPAVKSSETAVEPAANDVKADTATEEKSATAATVAMPKMIDFGSKQCKACQAMEPVLESLMKNHSDKFVTEFVDVWIPANQMYARSFKVSSIPTQVFVDASGEELFRNVGFISEEQVLAKWQELGVEFAAAKTSDNAAVDADTEVAVVEDAADEDTVQTSDNAAADTDTEVADVEKVADEADEADDADDADVAEDVKSE